MARKREREGLVVNPSPWFDSCLSPMHLWAHQCKVIVLHSPCWCPACTHGCAAPLFVPCVMLPGDARLSLTAGSLASVYSAFPEA